MDADGDGQFGGVGTVQFQTAPGQDPPLTTAPALIIGYAFAADRSPLAGATVNTYYYGDGIEGDPLPGSVQTDVNGYFEYTTIDITGKETFTVQVGKEGYSEALRKVEILAGRCWRIRDALLQPLQVPQDVSAEAGATLQDDTGQVTLIIPPKALEKDSRIGVTLLQSHEFIRDELPPLVARDGTFVDISGVFGDRTLLPVTLRVPNIYELQEGDPPVPFGKIDHNTLEWMHVGLGSVTPGGKHIEVQFTEFCTVCTGYCLPHPRMTNRGNRSPRPGGAGGDGDPDSDDKERDPPGEDCGNSVISIHEGDLSEVLPVTSFTEMGKSVGLSLAYSSRAARPSATLGSTIGYGNDRPVERTSFRFSVEGAIYEAFYDFSEGGLEHNGTKIWDPLGRLGLRLPTGSYAIRIDGASLNDDCPVGTAGSFGQEITFEYDEAVYPDLTLIQSDPVEDRAIVVNLEDSPYGAGWSLINEHRLYFDSDACIVLVSGNARALFFEPRGLNEYVSPAGDFSTLVFNPIDGTFVRSFRNGSAHYFNHEGRIERMVDRYGATTDFTYTGELLTRIDTPTGYWWDVRYTSGKLSSIADSAGRVVSVGVNGNGDLVSFIDAVGSTRTFAYDPNHLLIEQEMPRGERSEYDYDSHGLGRVVTSRAYGVDGFTLLRSRQYSPAVLRGELTGAADDGLGSFELPIPVVSDRTSRLREWTRFLELTGETREREDGQCD